MIGSSKDRPRKAIVKPLELTILIVDDLPDHAESLGVWLRDLGHTIYLAQDGREALADTIRFKPDVVLLDIQMPKISGLDVARMLSEEGDKKPLLVAISGFDSRDDKEAAFNAGFDHFFSKPIDHAALLVTLEDEDNFLFISRA
jgi:CheY-like chemotaxis protein